MCTHHSSLQVSSSNLRDSSRGPALLKQGKNEIGLSNLCNSTTTCSALNLILDFCLTFAFRIRTCELSEIQAIGRLRQEGLMVEATQGYIETLSQNKKMELAVCSEVEVAHD